MTMEFCDHKLEISGWNFKVRLLLQVSLKLLCLQLLCLQLASGSVQASCNDGELEIDPQAPGCLDDCEGRRFFLGRDGMCKMCVQCEPGFKHDKYCGDGENGDAVCIPCPEDHYSYNRYDCVACRVCENTLLTQECSATTDRQCGECLPGFYRDPQNPDLCNQRCEWLLSNPKTNPACEAWLANQQKPTQSTTITQMSFSPMLPVKRNGGVSLTVIIIICLVVVLISGSAIPVYLCCKHCKKSRGSKSDIESRPGQSREHLDLAVVPPDECHNSEDECCNSDGFIISGINDVGQVEMFITNPIAADVLKVVTVLPVSTVQEQVDGGGSVENEGEDKDPAKTVLEILDSANEIDFGNSISNSQMNRSSSNGTAEIPSDSVERADSGKVVHGLKENESSSDQYYPSCNSHGMNSRKPPFEMGRGEHDEGSGGKEESDKRPTLLPGADLRSIGGSVIGQDENEFRPVRFGSEGAPKNNVTRGGDDEHDGSMEERESLLPDAQVIHQNGEADEEKWRGSADAEKPQPTKMKEKDGPSKNDCGLGTRKKPQTVRSKESTVISHKNGKHMPTSLDSEKAQRNVGGAENEGEDMGKTGREDPDEHQRLLTDRQVRGHDGRAAGGYDREWRGSAEAEESRPTKRKKKDASRETKSGQLSAKRGKKKNRQQGVNLYITGKVNNLVVGDQIHYHNSAKHPPQGNAMHHNEDSEDDDDDEEDDDKEKEKEEEEEEDDDDDEEEEGEEDKVSSDTK